MVSRRGAGGLSECEAQTRQRMTEKRPVSQGLPRAITENQTISQGQETKYLLLLGKDLCFVRQEYYTCLRDRCDNVGKLLNGLINSLKAKEQLWQISKNQALGACRQELTTRDQEPRKD